MEGWVRWSNPVYATLRKPSPMPPSPVDETLARDLVADLIFREVDLAEVVEIKDLGLSEI